MNIMICFFFSYSFDLPITKAVSLDYPYIKCNENSISFTKFMIVFELLILFLCIFFHSFFFVDSVNFGYIPVCTPEEDEST